MERARDVVALFGDRPGGGRLLAKDQDQGVGRGVGRAAEVVAEQVANLGLIAGDDLQRPSDGGLERLDLLGLAFEDAAPGGGDAIEGTSPAAGEM